jgi:YHS domain-containing protein
MLTLLACFSAPAPTDAPAAAAAAPSASAPSAPVTRWEDVSPADGALVSTGAVLPFTNAAGAIACPVMGMAIATPADAVSFADHEGVRHYFCCDSCEKLFLEDPAAYAHGKYLRDHDLDPTAPAACDEKRAG